MRSLSDKRLKVSLGYPNVVDSIPSRIELKNLICTISVSITISDNNYFYLNI